MFNLVGEAANEPTIAKVAAALSGKLGDKIKAVSVVLKPDTEMPKRSDGGPAYGYWRPKLREIWLWDETDEYPVGKTLAHEAMHVLDTDWLTRTQRRSVMDLMSPVPTAWGDQRVDGVLHKYVALPSEVFAVYASAAIGDFAKPAYRSLYIRRIPADKWQALAQLVMTPHGPPEQEVEPVEEVFSPADPLQDTAKQIADAEARAAAAEAKLQQAHALANQINAL